MCKNKLLILIIFILATWFIIPTVTCAKSISKIPVIIDTDVSLDDLLAMIYLLQHKDIEVQGIAVVGTGETHCQPGIKNVGKLLKLVGKRNIPVACGQEKTIGSGHYFPDYIRHDADTMMGINLPGNDDINLYPDAFTLYQSILGNHQRKVTVLAIGPFTNLAELIQKEPGLQGKMNKIVAMGGALDVPGNVVEIKNKHQKVNAEWNFFVDPQAVNIILNSSVPVEIVPLDITNHIPLDKSFLAMLKKHRLSKVGKLVTNLVEKLLSNIQYESETWYFWDPLAAVILANPSKTSFKKEHVKILLSPEEKTGKLERHPQGQSVMVANKIDIEFVTSEYIKTISEI